MQPINTLKTVSIIDWYLYLYTAVLFTTIIYCRQEIDKTISTIDWIFRFACNCIVLYKHWMQTIDTLKAVSIIDSLSWFVFIFIVHNNHWTQTIYTLNYFYHYRLNIWICIELYGTQQTLNADNIYIRNCSP